VLGLVTQLIAGTYTYSGQVIPNAAIGGLGTARNHAAVTACPVEGVLDKSPSRPASPRRLVIEATYPL